MQDSDLCYRILSGLISTIISSPWTARDRFAAANGRHSASSTHVLERPLWHFIVDAETYDLYRRILKWDCVGRPLRFAFRCDSLTHRRLPEMKVAWVEDCMVEFRAHALLAAVSCAAIAAPRGCSL